MQQLAPANGAPRGISNQWLGFCAAGASVKNKALRAERQEGNAGKRAGAGRRVLFGAEGTPGQMPGPNEPLRALTARID